MTARRRVLVVDDDEDIRTIVRTLLEHAGYETSAAAGGREALESVAASPPDVVLLDVGMPEMSGWEVCTSLRSRPETAAIPIVMLTVRSEIRDLITSLQVGADDYVTKPFTRRRLLEALDGLWSGSARDRSGARSRLATEGRAHNLLFDPVTGLPTIPVLVDALREWLLVDQEVGVLVADLEALSQVEAFYGWESFDDLLRETARTLRGGLGTILAADDLIAVDRPSGSAFSVFVSLPAGLGGVEARERLQAKADAVARALRGALESRFAARMPRGGPLEVGFARLLYTPQVRLERLLYRALAEATAVASSRRGEEAALLKEQFRDILARRRIRTVYQPIVDLSTGAVVAHEALSRGPADTAFERPEALFSYAIRADQIWDLESLCLAFAAERFAGKRPGLLFVNTETALVHELKVRGHAILEPLLRLPGGVVLEITERAAIRDFDLFRESISVLRSLGFTVALDDAGSGYASLQAIAELKPNYLKISNTLVTGLARDAIKRDVVEMLVRLAARIDAYTVAEGIETDEDLAGVKALGVRFGQGYRLGRPVPLE
ncbi:MAG TPA: EAL domain-containing protein [Thermoanaerobaculia bacterium]|nr:EAL domain-containing protein [Thermoanaerobaculia bacterium]HQR67192.1 EAL domain-containing protein [Thermoanaerobaculia bacterium]